MVNQLTHGDILLAHSNEMLLLVSPETLEICAANGESYKKLGYTKELLLGKLITDVESALSDIFYWEDVRNGNAIEIHEAEGLYLQSDGSLLPVTKSILIYEDNTQKWLVIRAHDVQRQRQIESELEEITSQLRATLEATADGILVLGRDGRIVNMNQRFAQLWKIPRATLIGGNDRQVLEFLLENVTTPAHYRERMEVISALVEEETSDDLTLLDGTVLEQKSRPHQTSKEIVGRVFTFTNITDRKLAEEKIQSLAFYDPLTRLPNRRLLLDRLQQALAASARKKGVGALLFIDLDHFKTLNDTLGHDVGDLLLQQVAGRLVNCVREEDTVARLGGDEFVVVLSDIGRSVEEAAYRTEAVAEKILEMLNMTYYLGGHEYIGSPSIGVALFDDPLTGSDELMKRADIAMYQSKKAGRNTVRFFDPHMQAQVEAHSAIEKWMQKALPEHQFKLYYQIQVDQVGKVRGAEVLLRWQHPERGLIPPGDFIPIAEETGLIVPIGLWVLEAVCDQIRLWERDPGKRALQLSVNVSARQFHMPDFVKQIVKFLDKTEINPEHLKLELTESLVLNDINDTIAKMKTLKALGLRFSMDDFGTGHSSLSSLKKLPLDQLKIDQSFVRDITTDPDDAIIVQTIISMAKNLGMEVIAEGVETEEQRAFLESNGCECYQGYLFGRPVPIEELERQLERYELI